MRERSVELCRPNATESWRKAVAVALLAMAGWIAPSPHAQPTTTPDTTPDITPDITPGTNAAGISDPSVTDPSTLAAARGPAPDRHGVVGFIWENDTAPLKPNRSEDRYYTNGLLLYGGWQPEPTTQRAWLDALDAVPFFGVADSAADPRRAPRLAVGFQLAQLMYSPDDIDRLPVPRDDHPFAGHLYGGAFMQRSAPLGDGPAFGRGAYPGGGGMRVFDHLGVDIGWVGEGSGAESLQTEVHDWIGADTPRGWDQQVGDEATIQFTLARKWRLPLPMPGSHAADQGDAFGGAFGHQLIPGLQLDAGTARVSARMSVMYRLGLNLPDDFGPGLIGDLPDLTSTLSQPGPSLNRDRWFRHAYVFVAGGLRGVAHDLILDGGVFSDSRGLDAEPWVGDARVGLSLNLYRDDNLDCQLEYTQTFETARFDGQRGDSHEYASLHLRFVWQF